MADGDAEADAAAGTRDDEDHPRIRGETAPDRTLSRTSPLDGSASGLVSRDYRPRTGGPELVTSWPLGPAPGQDGPEVVDWELTGSDPVTIQRNLLSLPYVGGVDYAPLYLNVRGRVRLPPGATLELTLRCTHLSGKPYETTVWLDESDDFQSPFVEFVPDRPADYEPGGDTYAGYELRAAVDGDRAYVDQGTNVQLFSE